MICATSPAAQAQNACTLDPTVDPTVVQLSEAFRQEVCPVGTAQIDQVLNAFFFDGNANRDLSYIAGILARSARDPNAVLNAAEADRVSVSCQTTSRCVSGYRL